MKQPTIYEINNKLTELIDNKLTREEIGEWAFNFIKNDDYIEVNDIEAWGYLVSVSTIVDAMIAPNQYLYSIEYIKSLIKNKENTGAAEEEKRERPQPAGAAV